MCFYCSSLFSILFHRELNLLITELTSILSRDPERCEILLFLVVLNSLSVGIRWVSVNALVFGRITYVLFCFLETTQDSLCVFTVLQC